MPRYFCIEERTGGFNAQERSRMSYLSCVSIEREIGDTVIATRAVGMKTVACRRARVPGFFGDGRVHGAEYSSTRCYCTVSLCTRCIHTFPWGLSPYGIALEPSRLPCALRVR